MRQLNFQCIKEIVSTHSIKLSRSFLYFCLSGVLPVSSPALQPVLSIREIARNIPATESNQQARRRRLQVDNFPTAEPFTSFSPLGLTATPSPSVDAPSSDDDTPMPFTSFSPLGLTATPSPSPSPSVVAPEVGVQPSLGPMLFLPTLTESTLAPTPSLIVESTPVPTTAPTASPTSMCL